MSKTILKVDGMTCNHCKMRVEKAISGVNGVEHVEVDLAAKEVVVTGEVEQSKLAQVIVDAGYTVIK